MARLRLVRGSSAARPWFFRGNQPSVVKCFRKWFFLVFLLMPITTEFCDLAASLWMPSGCVLGAKHKQDGRSWRPVPRSGGFPLGAFWMRNTNRMGVLGGLPLGAVGGPLENAQKVSRRHPSENAVVRVQIWYTIGNFSARCTWNLSKPPELSFWEASPWARSAALS